MKDNKNKIFTIIALITIILTLIGTSYAFFAAQGNTVASVSSTVTSNTTDLLTFSISDDIEIEASQFDFEENYGNKSGEATATAILTPNNKTGNATMNYYLYLNLLSNPIVYSEANTNHDPELMLQVFDGNNQLVTLTGLGTQKTIKGVTGYDITGVSGVKTLLDNHAISASNNTIATENWRIVITLINLDVDQFENTGKNVRGRLIIKKDEILGYDDDPSSHFTINVSNPAAMDGRTISFDSNSINATWNNEANRLEISAIGKTNTGTITYETPTGTTPLNTYLLGLTGTTQGEGKFVHEIGGYPDFTNATVVKSFKSTPEFFQNTSSTSITKTNVDAYWTFDSSTGVFTSNPSKFTISGTGNYYHARFKVTENNYYQICYTINPSSNSNNLFVINYDYLGGPLNSITSVKASSSGVIEGCYDLEYMVTSDDWNMSQRGYSGTSSPVMSFRVEKANGTIPIDTGYRYEGKNPNNYVKFNNEIWRIIGVFSTEYDSNNDGTLDTTGNLVKIIRNDSIGCLSWAADNIWEDGRLYHILNEHYYDWETNKATISDYCYITSGTSGICDYSLIGIQDGYRGMITNSKWYLGGGGKKGHIDGTPVFVYSYERNPLTLLSERNISAIGYIGLMYESDYLYGVLETDCDRDYEGPYDYNSSSCAAKDWLSSEVMEWTLTSNFHYGNSAWYIGDNGNVKNAATGSGFGVRPVLYLNPSVYKISGTGTITDPYIIGM